MSYYAQGAIVTADRAFIASKVLTRQPDIKTATPGTAPTAPAPTAVVPSSGSKLLRWGIPIAVLVVGGALYLNKRRKQKSAPAAPKTETTP